jgi:hypothetical protein
MQYGEPFTHTGVLGTWNPNDQLSIIGGVTNGWDNWDDGLTDGAPIANPGPGQSSNASFLGAITFSSSDGLQALTIANSSGNQTSGATNPAAANFVGNRTVTSVVYSNELSDKLSYVYQSDFGYQAHANTVYQTQGQQVNSAYWYGVNQYMFYNFTDYLIGGLRLEWFRDNNGTRVATNGFRPGVNTGNNNGFAGNFWEMTWGLNYLIGNNMVIRPELRYDWFSRDQGTAGGAGNMPYGPNLDQNGQFYGGCDVVWQF